MSISLLGLSDKTETVSISIFPNKDHPLIKLAQVIPWEQMGEVVMEDLRKTTSKGFLNLGNKLYLRVHLGLYLLYLKTNKTERALEWETNDNATYQIFCGLNLTPLKRCPDHTSIQKFRSRLSPETHRILANMIPQLATNLRFADPSKADFDSTIQEPNIAYPSDANMLMQLVCHAHKFTEYFKNHMPTTKKIVDPIIIKLKETKGKLKEYLFTAKTKSEEKKQKLKGFIELAGQELSKVSQMHLTEKCLERIPRGISQSFQKVKDLSKRMIEQTNYYWEYGKASANRLYSLHAKDISCFNKNKPGKKWQFGRAFQLARIKGNFVFVGKCTDIRMEDKSSVVPMVEEHQRLFGEKKLKSGSWDKGYYKNSNKNYLDKLGSLKDFALQKPGQVIEAISKEKQEEYLRLVDRRSGVEPCIGHIKNGGQLKRSRMKSDESTLAAGYGAVTGYNLRMLIRHQLGKKISSM